MERMRASTLPSVDGMTKGGTNGAPSSGEGSKDAPRMQSRFRNGTERLRALGKDGWFEPSPNEALTLVNEHFALIRNACAEWSPVVYHLSAVDAASRLACFSIRPRGSQPPSSVSGLSVPSSSLSSGSDKHKHWDAMGGGPMDETKVDQLQVMSNESNQDQETFASVWCSLGDYVCGYLPEEWEQASGVPRPQADHESLWIRRSSAYARRPDAFECVYTWSTGSIWKPIAWKASTNSTESSAVQIEDDEWVAMGYVASGKPQPSNPNEEFVPDEEWFDSIRLVHRDCFHVWETREDREQAQMVRMQSMQLESKLMPSRNNTKSVWPFVRQPYHSTFVSQEEPTRILKSSLNVRAQSIGFPVVLQPIGNAFQYIGDDNGTLGSPDVAYYAGQPVQANVGALPTGYGIVSDFFFTRGTTSGDAIRSSLTYYVSLSPEVSCRVTYQTPPARVVSGSHRLDIHKGTATGWPQLGLPASKYKCIGLYLWSSYIESWNFWSSRNSITTYMLAVHEDYLVSFPQVPAGPHPTMIWAGRGVQIYRPFGEVACLNYPGSDDGFFYDNIFRPITLEDKTACCMGRLGQDVKCGSSARLNFLPPSSTNLVTSRCDLFMTDYCQSVEYKDSVCGCLNPEQLPPEVRNLPTIIASIGATADWQCFNMKCAPGEDTYKPTQFLTRQCNLTICTQLQIAQGVNVVQSGNNNVLVCPGSNSVSTTTSTSIDGTGTSTGTSTSTSTSSGNFFQDFFTAGTPDGSYNLWIILGVIAAVLVIGAVLYSAVRRNSSSSEQPSEDPNAYNDPYNVPPYY